MDRETFEQKMQRVLSDKVEVVPYDPAWPDDFKTERDHLLACLPRELFVRIEHFGSTAVPGLAAKPIIDMLIEVRDLEAVQEIVVPILEGQGYDYFWRPTEGDDGAPFYAWFIKRDKEGQRTHHLHMVEAHFEHWDRLLFRDYLIENPAIALEYQTLKTRLSKMHPNDRVVYTREKTAFIERVTRLAKSLDKNR